MFQFGSLGARLKEIYGTGKACRSSGECLYLDPGQRSMSWIHILSSRLEYRPQRNWLEWRDLLRPDITENGDEPGGPYDISSSCGILGFISNFI